MDNKIFITLGSQKFQFNRLLKAVDELCEKGTVDAEDVFAQIGYLQWESCAHSASVFSFFLYIRQFCQRKSMARLIY